MDAHLTAETNGVVTTVTGHGPRVTWDLVDAAEVIRDQPSIGRPMLRAVGERFDGAGLVLEVREGPVTLLEVGAVSSLLGRLFFGSPRVRPRSLWRLVRLSR